MTTIQESNTLQGMVRDLNFLQTIQNDVIVPNTSLVMRGTAVTIPELDTALRPTEVFKRQMAEKIQFPKSYWNKLEDKGYQRLIAENVNTLLHGGEDKNYTVRMYKGAGQRKARAFVSDKYQFIDNLPVVMQILETINAARKDLPELEIKECDLTDSKMYINIQLKNPIQAKELLSRYRRPDGKEVHGDLQYGIVSGVTVSNSEVGDGSYLLQAYARVSKCKNRVLFTEDEFRKIHLGGRKGEGNLKFKQDTLQAEMKAITLKTRDALEHFLTPEYFSGRVEKLTDLTGYEINEPMERVPYVLKKELGATIPKSKQDGILEAFLKGGDTSAMGLVHAITWESQKASNADAKYSMDKAAGKLVENTKWLRMLN